VTGGGIFWGGGEAMGIKVRMGPEAIEVNSAYTVHVVLLLLLRARRQLYTLYFAPTNTFPHDILTNYSPEAGCKSGTPLLSGIAPLQASQLSGLFRTVLPTARS
jgi:hypothetical protein